jgi:NAD(P)-dependent dehydrogenase (short-subunit alcohol dehydrogenase family)
MLARMGDSTRNLVDKDLAMLCVLFALLAWFVPVARAAAIIASLLGTTAFSMTAGSGEAQGLSPRSLATLTGAGALQLLPGRVEATVVVLVCLAYAVLTHRYLVRIPLPPLPRLDSKVVVVTGSSTGIGEATAVHLLGLGATVVFACRTEARAQAAMRRACAAANVSIDKAIFIALDLGSCVSVRQCATEVRSKCGRCDALVCNAGGMHPERGVTADGWETNFGSHALAHHLLTQLLLPLLRQRGGRVVNVSSATHKAADAAALLADPMSEREYSMFPSYARSKLAQVILTAEMQRREDGLSASQMHSVVGGDASGSRVVCTSLHPGNAMTEVTREFPWAIRAGYALCAPLFRWAQPTIADSASTSAFAVASPDTQALRGAYLEHCTPVAASSAAADLAVGRKLWELSEALIKPWRD